MTTALITLAILAGLVAYALIAMITIRKIGRRMTYDTEVVGWIAGALWPIGLPLLLGVWLGLRATRMR